MPAGLLVTVPEPATATVKVDIACGGGGGVVCVPVLPPPQDERKSKPERPMQAFKKNIFFTTRYSVQNRKPRQLNLVTDSRTVY